MSFEESACVGPEDYKEAARRADLKRAFHDQPLVTRGRHEALRYTLYESSHIVPQDHLHPPPASKAIHSSSCAAGVLLWRCTNLGRRSPGPSAPPEEADRSLAVQGEFPPHLLVELLPAHLQKDPVPIPIHQATLG